MPVQTRQLIMANSIARGVGKCHSKLDKAGYLEEREWSVIYRIEEWDAEARTWVVLKRNHTHAFESHWAMQRAAVRAIRCRHMERECFVRITVWDLLLLEGVLNRGGGTDRGRMLTVSVLSVPCL